MNDDDLGIPEFLRRKLGEKPPVSDYVFPTTEVPAPRPLSMPRSLRPHLMRRPTLLADIEGMIDDSSIGIEPFSVYAALCALRTRGVITARMIIDHFSPRLVELDELNNRSCDPQLREGYSGLTPEYIEVIRAMLRTVIEDAERFCVNNRSGKRVSIRLPRKRNAQKQVAKLKYMATFAPLQLVSVDPVKLIGAMTAWVYDTKTRRLTMYVSNSRSGFEVRGSSLRAIDAEASVNKTLRKPEVVLTSLLMANKKTAIAMIGEIKTKGATPSPRFNSNIVILRTEI